MFKLVVLSALLAVAAARPGYLETPLVYAQPTVTVQESSLAHVGNIVKSVPSAVSHHSNSVVHSHAHVVEDVVAPAIKTTSYTTKTLATPIVESYAAPVHTYAAATPLVQSYAAATPLVQSYAAAAPVYHSYAASAPVVHSYAAAPLAQSYAALPGVTSYAASSPLTYTATGIW